MNKFKQLLTAIQTFMDTEIELTEQAISHYERRPRIPYMMGGALLGSYMGLLITLAHIYNNTFWYLTGLITSLVIIALLFISYITSKKEISNL